MGEEAHLIVTSRHGPDRVVVEVSGELDMLGAPELEAALGAIDFNGSQALVLDLRGVTFMDSTGLRLVFSARSRATERGRLFAVTPSSEQVQRLLSLTRLDEHLRTIGAPDDAL
jgi:anti-sigma B factor antagonist